MPIKLEQIRLFDETEVAVLQIVLNYFIQVDIERE